MSDIDELVAWCEEARKILQTTGSKKGAGAADFQKALDKVARGMRELVKLAGQALSVRTLDSMFQRIAEDALALKTSNQSEDKKRKAAKGITTRLEALTKDILKAKPAAEKVARYQERMAECRNTRNHLATFPYAVLSAVDNVINEATLGGEALDDPTIVDKALEVLAGFDKAVKLAEAEQQKGAKAAEENLRAQADCLERLRQVNEVLDQALATGLGVAAEINALRAATGKAGTLVGQSQWRQALEILNSSKPKLPTLEDIRKSGEKALKGLPPQAREAQEQLVVYQGLVDGELHAQAATALKEQLALALEQLGSRDVLAAKALQGVKDLILKATAARDQAVRDANSIARVIEEAKPNLTQLALLDLQSQLDLLRVEIEQKHLFVAEKSAKLLLTEATKVALEAKTARAGWTNAEADFNLQLSALGQHATDAEAPPEARSACARLEVTATKTRPGMVTAGDWAGLLELYRSLQDGVAAFLKAKQDYADFALLRAEGKRLLAREFELTTQALEAAEVLLGKQPGLDAEGVLKPLRLQLKDAFDAWEDRVANATSSEELDAEGTHQLLVALDKAIAAATRPEAIEGSKTAQAETRFEAAFEDLALGLESLFARLEDVDMAQGTLAREKLDKLRAKAGLTWEAKLPMVEDIAAEMRTALNLARERQAGRSDLLLQTCETLQQRLQVQQDKLKSSPDKTFLPLFEDLNRQLADQRALAVSPNVNAADAVAKALKALELQIRGIESLSSNGSAFERVRNELKILNNAIDKAASDLQDNVPKTLASLRKLANELQTEMLTMTPDEAINEINVLRVSVRQASLESRKVQALRQGFSDLKPAVENKIKLLGDEGTVPALVKVLQQRLESAVSTARNPDKLFMARQMLDQLNHDVEAAFVEPEKGLEMQKKALEEAERKRLLKVQFEAGLASVKKAPLKRAQDAVTKAGGDSAMLAEIGRMIDDTAEIGRGGDHAEALRKLALVEQRIEEVIADPHGPGIGSRKALPNDAKLYAESANKLITGLRQLPQMVAGRLAKATPPLRLDEQGPLLSKLGTQIEQLVRRIDPALFAEPARLLADSKRPARDRRATRETALQTLRDTRALLGEQPQFAALWSNPFHVELKANKTELDQRLMRLEANIRRSVH